MKRFLDLPPVWLFFFMCLHWLVVLMAQGQSANPFLRLLGLVFMLAGFILIIWAAIWFRREQTPIHPGHAPSALIQSGPFRFSRNPIYLGMAVIFCGFVVWTGQPLGFLLVPFFIGTITNRFIRHEEQRLRDAFGDEAERYLSQTRRWL